MDLTQFVATSMAVEPDVALATWADCGAMSLTGRADGPALTGPARIAVAMDALADRLTEMTARLGRCVRVNGAALLAERAAIARLSRQGSTSCGGATRLIRVCDQWIAVSLARPSDVELLPAWLERPSPTGSGWATDALWDHVADVLRDGDANEVVARAELLGLPCARLGEVSAEKPIAPIGLARRARRPPRLDRCVVVDLSSLWAGPLCANLLGLAGARVIKVESTSRPDGARDGPSDFFDLLHAGHQSVAFPFQAAEGREQLAALLRVADIVIESSRPRALEAMGIAANEMLTGDGPAVWLSITGYGRDDGSNRVAFGDDAAVAGGLVAVDDQGPVFCADAVGDPASGLLAAVAVLDLIDQGVGGLVDIALARTCAHLAAGLADNPVPPVSQGIVVAPRPPAARTPSGVAAALGADTDAVSREFGLA